MINRTARTWADALSYAALIAVASNAAVAQTKFWKGL
jgi:hypothetical protein